LPDDEDFVEECGAGGLADLRAGLPDERDDLEGEPKPRRRSFHR